MSLREHFSRTLSDSLGIPSAKRFVVVAASLALIAVFIWVGYACGIRIHRFGDIGALAFALASTLGGIIAALAGVAYYKKPDQPKDGPS